MNKFNFNGIDFTIGMRIKASDGAPKPPERFNKKLAKWKDRNFSGTITELSEPASYYPGGGITTTRDDYPDRSYMKMRFTHPLGGAIDFEPIEEEA